MLITTPDGFYALTTDDQVVAAMQSQADGMRAASYDHSVILNSDVTVLNSTSALLHATFSRQRSDGSEIQQLTGTYLVTLSASGRRISVLAIRAA